jgi:hypothetical protein
MPLLFIAFLSPAQTPKTFYVGHSLTDQIPDMVQSLSDDHTSVDFSWVYQSIPGAPLRWQWDRKDADDYYPIPPNYYGFYDTTYGLPSGGFDILILTESVPRYPDIIDETYQYADSFYQYAIAYNPDVKVYLYEDWHCLLSGAPTGCDYDVDSNPWRQRLEDDLPMWESVVDTLNARFNPAIPICLIPGGQGLAALYDSIQIGAMPDLTDIEDVFSDDIHLNDTGKYYMACIHFAMIHETSPVGLTNQLQYWWGGAFDPPSAALALKFQEMAWETVNLYPRTCLDVTAAVDIQLDSNSLTLLPNPTQDVFEIQGLIGEYTIQILDALGNIYQTLTSTQDRIEVSIGSLPDGLYFIKVENNHINEVLVEKILKQN